ncbi:MAG: ABC transporter ATP-binding protein [Candidatus Hodarchaeales archaeon]
MAYLEVKNLAFSYNNHVVLENITFQASKGELIAIVGPSGCGKTTLLRLIVGILEPSEGSIFLDNRDITKKPIEHREVGYVPQNQSLFPHMTVIDNITFGLKSNNNEEKTDQIFELIRISGLEDLLSRKPRELSGGQKQRVALLRAIAPIPKLLLLDEPLSNIDSHLREKLALFIRSIQLNSHVTTLFVTHDLDEAKMLADRLILMKHGRILQIGSPRDVTLVPKSIETANILGLKNIFKIRSMLVTKERSMIILNTDIGVLKVPPSIVPRQADGVYIDPTKIKINSKELGYSIMLQGKILAIIPNLSIHQSTIIVQIASKNSLNLIHSDKRGLFGEVIHIQTSNSGLPYQLNDLVTISIPANSFTFL